MLFSQDVCFRSQQDSQTLVFSRTNKHDKTRHLFSAQLTDQPSSRCRRSCRHQNYSPNPIIISDFFFIFIKAPVLSSMSQFPRFRLIRLTHKNIQGCIWGENCENWFAAVSQKWLMCTSALMLHLHTELLGLVLPHNESSFHADNHFLGEKWRSFKMMDFLQRTSHFTTNSNTVRTCCEMFVCLV